MPQPLEDVLIGVEYFAEHLEPEDFPFLHEFLGEGQECSFEDILVVSVDHGDTGFLGG